MKAKSLTRRAITGALLVALPLAVAAPASAHVTVNPKSADQGSYARLTFRVPNEKTSATTTKVQVDIPITSVSVQPHAGWTYSIDKTKLAAPVKTGEAEVSEVVSRITWTADAGSAIKSGEFEEFNVSAGPLPKDVGALEFKALQTYSDGDIVRWIDTAAPGKDEPDHPAPKLTLTAPTSTTMNPVTTAPTATRNDVDNARKFGISGLIFGLVGIAVASLALVRKRR